METASVGLFSQLEEKTKNVQYRTYKSHQRNQGK